MKDERLPQQLVLEKSGALGTFCTYFKGGWVTRSGDPKQGKTLSQLLPEREGGKSGGRIAFHCASVHLG